VVRRESKSRPSSRREGRTFPPGHPYYVAALQDKPTAAVQLCLDLGEVQRRPRREDDPSVVRWMSPDFQSRSSESVQQPPSQFADDLLDRPGNPALPERQGVSSSPASPITKSPANSGFYVSEVRWAEAGRLWAAGGRVGGCAHVPNLRGRRQPCWGRYIDFGPASPLTQIARFSA